MGPTNQQPLHEGTKNDIFVLTLSPQGEYDWHTFYGIGTLFCKAAPTICRYSEEMGNAIALDHGNGLYIAGITQSSWNGPIVPGAPEGIPPLHDYFVSMVYWRLPPYDQMILKLTTDGQYRWHTFYGKGDDDFAKDIVVTPNLGNPPIGDVLVVGSSREDADELYPEQVSGVTVLKLSSNGDYQWQVRYAVADPLSSGNALALDAGGNLYITGTSYQSWDGPQGQSPLQPFSVIDSSQENTQGFSLSLYPNGGYRWHTFWRPVAGQALGGVDIVVDGSSVYMAGGSALDGSTYSPVFLQALDRQGNARWQHTFDSVETFSTFGARSITLDHQGSLILTGSSGSWNGPQGQLPIHLYTEDSQAALFVLKLSRLETQTTLQTSDTLVDVGQVVTFTAAVTTSQPGTPTGVVVFSMNGIPLAEVPLLPDNTAVFQTTLPPTLVQVKVAYGGDNTFGSSESPAVKVYTIPSFQLFLPEIRQ